MNEAILVLIYHVDILDQVKVLQHQVEKNVRREHLVLLVQLVVQIVLLVIIVLMHDHVVVQSVQTDKLVLNDLVVVLHLHQRQHLVLIIAVIGQIIDEVVLENVYEIQLIQVVLREFHIVIWVELLQLTSVVLMVKYVV